MLRSHAFRLGSQIRDILLDDTEGKTELAIQYVMPRPEWGKWR